MSEDYISFSQFRNWVQCPHYHKVVYIDKLYRFAGNEHTSFGTAIHDTYEKSLLTEQNFDKALHFNKKFLELLKELSEKGVTFDKKLVQDMRKQGSELAPLAIPALKEYFGDYEIFSVEEEIFESIEEFAKKEYKFKGFIDLVLKTKDGKYHILDWKTCSWGWNAQKRSDKIINYQLVFYKYFFAKKYKIDPKKIEIYFALAKRSKPGPRAKNQERVEIFRATSGAKKTDNALKFLTKALHNIVNGISIKNRLSCKYCDLYKTKLCK